MDKHKRCDTFGQAACAAVLADMDYEFLKPWLIELNAWLDRRLVQTRLGHRAPTLLMWYNGATLTEEIERMKRPVLRLAKLAAGLAALAVIAGAVYYFAGRAWMDRWGATDAEIGATLPGDELVPQPLGVVNRAVTIRAAPEQIYPWLVQMGAGKGGMYSYTGIETYMLNCPLVNAETIHPEWQDLKVGDEVKMCPQAGPPPYLVAALEPNRAVILGHKDAQGVWEETWAFVITPQPDGSSRLAARDRTVAVGGFWEVIHPGIFVMERGMLLGIKERAER